ncbi:MAG: 5-bromo-4-chloroindolyl phosphate hydrolysis family protein [Oscillospiraceae bacterium]|nr:5-bromo-4-chloroindolyl phosphate hydrolysis family protein [Oscillospiraceae bacterium]MBQ4643758.1 5-bromo-4-chloroindolyl phosphate hydrolysis family protein [Oscillospiraceae bacterium]
MDEKSTGAVGILAIAVCIAVLIAAKMFFPSLFTVLLWIIGIIIALILVLIGAVIYFAFRKPKPGEEETAKAKANRIISDGRNKVMSIRRNVMSIKNTAVKNSGIKVCSGADKILGVLRQKPELMQKNRQFFTYYLPTFGSIIEKYERIEKNEVASEDMVRKVLEHLDDMKIAFEKQYKSLFSGDMLDLTVEIEAMTIACKRDGLLSEEDFEKDKDNSIDLEF